METEFKISVHMLDKCVCDFYEYMGRDKKPTKERIGLWFQKLKEVKPTDLVEAMSYMKDNLDAMPHNLPKAIKSAILNLEKATPQPEKPQFGAYGKCDDCNGSGCFNVLMFSKSGLRYEPIQFCSRCENWRIWTNDPGNKISAAELIASGFSFKPYNSVKYQHHTAAGQRWRA